MILRMGSGGCLGFWLVGAVREPPLRGPPLSFGHFPRAAGETLPHGHPDHPHPSPLPSRERGCRCSATPGIPRTLASLVRAPFVSRKGQPPPSPLLKEGESWCSAPSGYPPVRV